MGYGNTSKELTSLPDLWKQCNSCSGLPRKTKPLSSIYISGTIFYFCMFQREHELEANIRQRQVQELRKSLNMVKKTQIEPQLLNELILLEKRHFAEKMGIRRTTHHLRYHCHVWASRQSINDSLKAIDPDGLGIRRARKLKRRIFNSDGPDEVWSLDGHDKLKHWGFFTHGCMDVYSRYLVWLRLGTSNHNPDYVLSYYLDGIKEIAASGSFPEGISLWLY
jgi:hypothetical protein